MVRMLPAALMAAMLLLASCSSSTSPQDMNVTIVTLPNGARIKAETMRNDLDMVRGMMFREAFDSSRGMLFFQPEEARLATWMYQVKVPLDIVWLGRDRRIKEIVSNVPPCQSTSAKQCPTYGGTFASRYILELNAGQAAVYGLKVGDLLSF